MKPIDQIDYYFLVDIQVDKYVQFFCDSSYHYLEISVQF